MFEELDLKVGEEKAAPDLGKTCFYPCNVTSFDCFRTGCCRPPK